MKRKLYFIYNDSKTKFLGRLLDEITAFSIREAFIIAKEKYPSKKILVRLNRNK